MMDIQEIFKAQSQHQYTLGNSSASQRISRLNALQKAVEKTYRKPYTKTLKNPLLRQISPKFTP
jgi:hypothetical protein